MQKIKRYNETLRAMEQLQKELAAMEQDVDLKKEREFIDNLASIIAEYGYTNREALEILGFTVDLSDSDKKASGAVEGQRQIKTAYENPHTGERVVGDRRKKIIRAWFKTYGDDVVEKWRIDL